MKYIMIGGITLDDTVVYHGPTMFDAPGGNSIYSALGARLWSDGIGIVGCVGSDYPQQHIDRLENGGIDVRGVQRVDVPSQHLWLLYEADGSRQFVFHRNSSRMESPIDPTPQHIPAEYRAAKNAHLSAMGFHAQHALASFLAQNNIPFSYDIAQASLPLDGDAYAQNFATTHCNLLLPSIEEVQLIYGARPLLPLLREVAQSGPQAIAVKTGARGSIIYDGRAKKAYRVPIYPTAVVDTTGAGDAYCGGFVCGYYETGDIIEAGVWGTVSASFAIQDFGAIHMLDVTLEATARRANQVRQQVESIPID